jgi:tRNA pseudouridine55 synthase
VLGVLLVDKPQGLSSHDVVARIRRRFGTKRVGHAGTLDPQATGLLVIAVGPATRFLQYFPLEPKEYVAEVTFGVATDTQDGEGEVTFEAEVPRDLEFEIDYVMPRFRGLIEQIPPMYSAVKKDGQPLYKYARRGEEVERALRKVHIKEVDLLQIESPIASFRLVCSGGTYVRTWANDLGEAMGCRAYLSGLRRTQIGKFHVDDAVTWEEATPQDLIPLDQALPPMPLMTLNERQAAAIRNGQAIGNHEHRSGHVGLVAPDGEVIGVAQAQGNVVQPECVIPMSPESHG